MLLWGQLFASMTGQTGKLPSNEATHCCLTNSPPNQALEELVLMYWILRGALLIFCHLITCSFYDTPICQELHTHSNWYSSYREQLWNSIPCTPSPWINYLTLHKLSQMLGVTLRIALRILSVEEECARKEREMAWGRTSPADNTKWREQRCD